MTAYGADWTERIRLPSGEEIALRPLTREDEAGILHALREMSSESRMRRFLSPLGDAEMLAKKLVDVDQVRHVAIVAVLESSDLKTERGVGVARFICLADEPTVAEAAVSVADDMQRRGLGRVLLNRLVRVAQSRGITTFRAEVLKSNEPVLAVLKQAGATIREETDASIVFDVNLVGPAEDASLYSLLRDAARRLLDVVRPSFK
jgi:GNAT superfamily N-acetyltransferase